MHKETCGMMENNILSDALFKEKPYLWFNPYMLDKFMRESNAIEGELEDGGGRGRLNRGDIQAAHLMLGYKEVTLEKLLKVHEKLGEYLHVVWNGRLREVDVRVGTYKAPRWIEVADLMADYIKKYKKMDSFEAYNEFEMIHPFRDINGRTGRLLWLKKALKEGYRFNISFLHKYHYQTLDRHHSLIIKK